MSVNLGTRDKNIVLETITVTWTNDVTYPFDTFVAPANNITSAIEAAGTFGLCRSNAVAVTGSTESKGLLQIHFFFTLNSGTEDARVIKFKDGVSIGLEGFAPGQRTHSIVVDEDGDYSFGIITGATMAAMDFTTTNTTMEKSDG